MDRYAMNEALRALAQEYINGQGLELVDLMCIRQGRDLVIRVLADRPGGGITLDECARLNTELGKLFDRQDLLQEGYTLEVSSPGLDRPLKTAHDFLRCKDKLVKFFVREPLEGRLEFEGTIEGADEENVYVRAREKALIVKLSVIAKAKQVITDI